MGNSVIHCSIFISILSIAFVLNSRDSKDAIRIYGSRKLCVQGIYMHASTYEQYVYCSSNVLTARQVRRICIMRFSKVRNKDLMHVIEFSTSKTRLDFSR